MKHMIPFLLGVLAVLSAHGQETEGVSYSANLGITFTSGNSNTDQVNAGFKAEKITETREYFVEAFYDYGRSEQTQDGEEVRVTNLDKGKIEAKGNVVLSEKSYAYISISAERNEISGIDRRVAAGPGLGHYLQRNDIMTLGVEGGLVWVFEEIDNTSNDYAAFRLAQNLKWALTEGATLRQDFEVIMDVEDEENYFINASIVAEASLTASLGLRTEIRNSYNNQPGSDKEQNDVILRTGISVTW